MKFFQQAHMLQNVTAYQELLKRFNLTDFSVIEFGAGDGVLTKIILEAAPKELIAYEIEPELADALQKKLPDPRLKLKIMDFTKEDFSFLSEGKWCIISNPPYSTIPFLNELIKKYQIEDVIMMTSPKKQAMFFSDYTEEFTLEGSDFEPPATGIHSVVRKGFSHSLKPEIEESNKEAFTL